MCRLERTVSSSVYRPRSRYPLPTDLYLTAGQVRRDQRLRADCRQYNPAGQHRRTCARALCGDSGEVRRGPTRDHTRACGGADEDALSAVCAARGGIGWHEDQWRLMLPDLVVS